MIWLTIYLVGIPIWFLLGRLNVLGLRDAHRETTTAYGDFHAAMAAAVALAIWPIMVALLGFSLIFQEDSSE